jgi:cysteine-S-conjugate beta-lyase
VDFDFDRIIDRRGTNSIKWKLYPADVLPLWVADMDFAAPEPVISALQARLEHGILGYELPPRELLETVAARMERLYHWKVDPSMVVATPGVVAGFVIAVHAVCAGGEGIVVQQPVYPPFLKVHEHAHLVRQDAPLAPIASDNSLRYEVDFDVFARAFHSAGANTGMFLFCNPHNPTGQVYSREDLAHLAEICLQKDVVICSDEIHSELLLGGAEHFPIAALDPQVADRSITLVSPSKTFNIPGLFCGFAIIPNKDLLERYKKTVENLAMHVSSLGMFAAKTAFSGVCDDWLAALRSYLTANRDFLVSFIQHELPGIKTTIPAATYLAWLDCNGLVEAGKISASPAKFFLEQARVALNEGADFGPGGNGFVRLNFGCPRSILVEALGRMKSSLRL